MATANEQIRVNDRLEKQLDRRRREGESYNDVLERLLSENTAADFYDGFGILSDDEADWIREKHDGAREKQKEQLAAACPGRQFSVTWPTRGGGVLTVHRDIARTPDPNRPGPCW